MLRKTIVVVLLCISVIIAVYYMNGLPEATFNNGTLEIHIGEVKYVLTNDTVLADELLDDIAKVSQVITVVSYLEDENPFKNIGLIYTIKNEKKNVAVEVDGIYYLARKVE